MRVCCSVVVSISFLGCQVKHQRFKLIKRSKEKIERKSESRIILMSPGAVQCQQWEKKISSWWIWERGIGQPCRTSRSWGLSLGLLAFKGSPARWGLIAFKPTSLQNKARKDQFQVLWACQACLYFGLLPKQCCSLCLHSVKSPEKNLFNHCGFL